MLNDCNIIEQLFDVFHDAVYIINQKHEFIYANESATKMLGYTKDEFLQMHVSDIDPQYTQRVLTKSKNTPLSMILESEHKTKSGFMFPVEITKTYFDNNNNPLIVAIAHDISERKLIHELSAKRIQLFHTLVELSLDTIAQYDRQCRRTYMNPTLINLMGNDVNLIGETPSEYHATPQAKEFEANIIQVFETATPLEIEFPWNDKWGNTIIYMIRLLPEVDETGNVQSVFAIGRDITRIKEYGEYLKREKKKLLEAQSIAHLGNWEMLFPDMTLEWSREIYRIIDVSSLEQPSHELFISRIHPDDRELFDVSYHLSVINHTPFDLVIRLSFDETIKYIHIRAETHYDLDNKPLRTIGTIQDITERVVLEKNMEYMANHDHLTGLPNRKMARDTVERMIRSSNSILAIMFIDLDGFKNINDSLGHSFGDALLKSVSSRFGTILRSSDIIYRLGGDEFLLVLPDIKNLNDIELVIHKIFDEFKRPFIVLNHTLFVSMSIGVSLSPNHGDSFELLLQKADTAMYKAKENGKNGYFIYNESLSHNTIGEFKLLKDLKDAITKNQFELYYQPQFELNSLNIIGAEALIRWNHPQMGLIPPMQFIAISEKNGLIVEIGEWVINEACRQGALWSAQGKNIAIAVNISALQFKRGNLEQIITKALENSGFDPRLLELELTESILINDTDKVLEAVKNLKSLGIQLSIDDFGTGYSSLSYLKRFAVDKLKIDQSFVRDILTNSEDEIIVKTIIQMAECFNLKTIAEGVENSEVLQILSDFGCMEAQGYHFDKPLKADIFEHKYLYQDQGIPYD